MACLLAATVHDFEHKGLSNPFLVQTEDERALRFNDKHANENHHVAAAFELAPRPDCNFLAELPPAQHRRLRSLVVDLVLATDMADGNALLKSISETLAAAGIDAKLPSGADPPVFTPTSDRDVTLAL